jgi:predicted nucleotidyltransferase
VAEPRLERPGRTAYLGGMDKDAVIAVLRAHRTELEKLGIRHAGLFGSLARGDAGPESDIDIAIELDETRHPTIYDYVGMQQAVSELFASPTDVVDIEAMQPRMRRRVEADLVDAF